MVTFKQILESNEQSQGGDPRFLGLLDRMRDLHIRKSQDYGSGADPLANLRAGEAFGIPAWVGAMIRANDKVHRLQEFAKKGSLANESAEDSMMDLACYALLALVLYRERSQCKEAVKDEADRR